MYRQVTGGACRLVIYRESALKTPDSASGVLLAINSESFKSGANKKQSGVIRGKRGPGKPSRGLAQLSGGIESPAYAPQMGHLFRALCGAPTTTEVAVVSCSAGPAVDKGGGFVGIPCAGHGYVQDDTVTIVGSTKYDGTYRVERGTTTDELVIAAPYLAETMTAAMKVHRGRVARLKGAAAAGTTGKSVLPTSGLHGLQPGDSVTITGTTSYAGTYVLQAGTKERSLVITKAFVAETFDGTPTVAPKFYRHAFTLPPVQPSVCIEKVLDYEAGAAAKPVRRYLGCKVNSLGFKLGGDDQLTLSLDMVPLEEFAAPAPLLASPAKTPSVEFDNIESAFFIAGVRRGDIESGSVTCSFGVEAKAAVGDRGQYSRSSEGDPDIKAALTCFVESDELQVLSDADATVQFRAVICGGDGDQFAFDLPEAELASEAAAITTKAGLMQDVQVMAFVDQAASVLSLTLINRVASYA